MLKILAAAIGVIAGSIGAAIATLFGFVIVVGLFASIPIVIGRHFKADDESQRELTERHNKLAEEQIVQCIHDNGIAKFDNHDRYQGCDPLP